ncbi:MAG: UbiD family decarboxylase [Candidatus Nezhaarchaeales archaeon]
MPGKTYNGRGAYGLKTVTVVDDDVDPSDISRVLWALSARHQPLQRYCTEITKRGRSTLPGPSLPIDPEARLITSRIIIDATIPYEWRQKPIPVELDKAVVEKVKSRWKELFP